MESIPSLIPLAVGLLVVVIGLGSLRRGGEMARAVEVKLPAGIEIKGNNVGVVLIVVGAVIAGGSGYSAITIREQEVELTALVDDLLTLVAERENRTAGEHEDLETRLAEMTRLLETVHDAIVREEVVRLETGEEAHVEPEPASEDPAAAVRSPRDELSPETLRAIRRIRPEAPLEHAR